MYRQQTNAKGRPSAAELQTALRRAIAELDGLVGRMGCDRRWKSGKCEILPLDRSLMDLAKGATF